MKNLILKTSLLLLLISCFQPAFGQITTQKKSKYRTWVMENEDFIFQTEVKMINAGDTSFTAIPIGGDIPLVWVTHFSFVGEAFTDDLGVLKNYEPKNVRSIKFRKKRSQLRGALIGSAVGLLSGVAYSKLEDNYFLTPGLVGTFGALTGGYLGYLIGSLKVTVPINGNKLNYKRNLKKIRKYTLLHD